VELNGLFMGVNEIGELDIAEDKVDDDNIDEVEGGTIGVLEIGVFEIQLLFTLFLGIKEIGEVGIIEDIGEERRQHYGHRSHESVDSHEDSNGRHHRRNKHHHGHKHHRHNNRSENASSDKRSSEEANYEKYKPRHRTAPQRLRYTLATTNRWTNDNGDDYSQLDVTLINDGDAAICDAILEFAYGSSNETRVENSWNLEELDDEHNIDRHRHQHRYRLPDGTRLATTGRYVAGLIIVGRAPTMRIDETKKCE